MGYDYRETENILECRETNGNMLKSISEKIIKILIKRRIKELEYLTKHKMYLFALVPKKTTLL